MLNMMNVGTRQNAKNRYFCFLDCTIQSLFLVKIRVWNAKAGFHIPYTFTFLTELLTISVFLSRLFCFFYKFFSSNIAEHQRNERITDRRLQISTHRVRLMIDLD